MVSVGLLTWAGCASSSLKGGLPGSELPKELPADLQQRFEIKDTPPPVVLKTAPSPVASPAPPPEKKKKKRKAKEPAPWPSPSAAPTAESGLAPEFHYPVRRPAVDPIWLGEHFEYEVTYFGMAAGLFSLRTLPYKAVGDRKVYYIKGTAESSKVFSLFYRLNDTVETFIDFEGIFSHRFHLVLDESKQARDALELYDSIKAQTFYWNKWNRQDAGYSETKEFQPIVSFPQDSLSAIYYMRTVPMPPGGVFSFPVVSEGKMWEAEVSVIRREILETPLGRVRTVMVKPETKFQGVLQKRGDSFMWFTDDDRRILVRLEAKVKIGTGAGVLRKAELGQAPGH